MKKYLLTPRIFGLLLSAAMIGCAPAGPNVQTAKPPVEIATQVVLAHPKIEVGKEIEAPATVAITPWQPSQKCVALAEEYIGKMSTAQKAGQMAQVAIRYISDPTDLATYGIGSMLAGGSDYPPGDLTAKSWADYIDGVKAAALKSEFGIPLLFGIDAVHGNGKSEGAVVFPHNIGLGCTGDPALVEEIGRVTAKETLGSGVDWAFSPVLAAARDERWGRTYEAFGETPELAATFGTALIRGIQDGALGHSPTSALACAKHFAGDGATSFGTSTMEAAVLDRGNTLLSDADFWRLAVEQYIPAIEAGVGSIMVSYSSVNGRRMHGEKNLLTNILKGTLGFNGFLVSDWKGIDDIDGDFTTDVITAINAGIDMVMIPDDYKKFIEIIVSAVPERISEERVNDAAKRILTIKCEMGMFEDTYSPNTSEALTAEVGSDAHRQVARRAVAKSMVLLKNTNHLLPFKKDIKVHVAGSGADSLDKQCGGWTITWTGQGSRTQGTTVLQAIQNAIGKENVSYSVDALQVPKDAAVGVVVVGEYPYSEWRGDDTQLVLDGEDLAAVANMKKAGIPFVTVLFSGRPMMIGEMLESSSAFVAAWLPGTEGAGIADVLFGDQPFVGKLSHTWPKSVSQLPLNVGDATYAPLFPFGFGLTTP